MNNEIPKSDYEIFREEKHESLNAPHAVIVDAAEKATGASVSSEKRIIAGETNEVHEITTDDGGEVIVRIYHGEKPKFERERWAIEQCKASGVPVPEVLLVEESKREGSTLFVCVESKVEGVSLGNIPEITEPKNSERLKELLYKTGEQLSTIHSISTNGFGSLDKNGQGKYDSVQSLLTEDQFRNPENILSESKLKITDHDTVQLVNRAHEIIIAQADSLPVISPKLLHGDFGPQHILIKDGEISGVIDFEFAKGSDPTEEFARWELKFKDYPLEYIQAGYGNKELFEGDFERRKYIWRLFQGLAIMRYCAREGKQFGIDKIVPELRKSVDYFI